MSDDQRAIGLDIGGTNIRIAEVTADGTVLEREREPTPFGDPQAIVATIAKLVARRRPGLSVGVGIAGGISTDGVVRFSPNIGLGDVDLAAMLHEALGHRVLVVNDASAAVWAEHEIGAGRGVDDIVMLTIGTGVGGGIIAGGRLLTGATGLGGELGHMVVVEGGAQCACGNKGCLEAYAAGGTLAQPGRTSAETVELARQGDIDARAHVAAVGRWIGIGAASLAALLDPALIVLGGGAGDAAFDLLVEPARAAFAERLFARSHRAQPPIVGAKVGDDAGVIGAALLAMRARSTT